VIELDEHGDPPWLAIARGELGVHETPGPASTKRIDEYLRSTMLPERYIEDETPWCAAFVCWCLHQAGLASTRSAGARSYLRWGQELQEPRVGCIAVLTRPGHATSGHVGFWLGMAGPDKVRLLGGNQNNAVCTRVYDASRVLSYRWPIVG
jgi:uncharacterized protein (TIGR02594 family)